MLMLMLMFFSCNLCPEILRSRYPGYLVLNKIRNILVMSVILQYSPTILNNTQYDFFERSLLCKYPTAQQPRGYDTALVVGIIIIIINIIIIIVIAILLITFIAINDLTTGRRSPSNSKGFVIGIKTDAKSQNLVASVRGLFL